MFTSLTTLPLVLNQDPYNYSDSVIGLTFLPIGVFMLLGAVIGGVLSDKASAIYNKFPEGRLYYSIIPIWMVPVGGIAFGYSLQYKANIAAVLITQSILGYGQAVLMPSLLGYFSSMYPQNSGTVGSVMLFLCFIGSAITISIFVPISNPIGVGGYYLLISVITAIICLWCTIVILKKSEK